MPGTASFTALQDLDVGVARVVRVNAALHAHFGGAAVPAFARAALDFVERQIVGTAAQVLRQFALRECAELAFEVADVRVVDVAVDDVADHIAIDVAANRVGRVDDRGEVVAARIEQTHDFGFGQIGAAFGAFNDGCNLNGCGDIGAADCGEYVGRRAGCLAR